MPEVPKEDTPKEELPPLPPGFHRVQIGGKWRRVFVDPSGRVSLADAGGQPPSKPTLRQDRERPGRR